MTTNKKLLREQTTQPHLWKQTYLLACISEVSGRRSGRWSVWDSVYEDGSPSRCESGCVLRLGPRSLSWARPGAGWCCAFSSWLSQDRAVPRHKTACLPNATHSHTPHGQSQHEHCFISLRFSFLLALWWSRMQGHSHKHSTHTYTRLCSETRQTAEARLPRYP